MTVETRRVWTRANVLPLAAGTFLLAGAACWLWARLGNRPNAGAIRDGVWYAGLLLTGVPVVVRTLMQAARGHLATDLVAALAVGCLLYTSDAADEEDSVDLGGRRI